MKIKRKGQLGDAEDSKLPLPLLFVAICGGFGLSVFALRAIRSYYAEKIIKEKAAAAVQDIGQKFKSIFSKGSSPPVASKEGIPPETQA